MKGLVQSRCLKVSHDQQESCLSAATAVPASVVPFEMEPSSSSGVSRLPTPAPARFPQRGGHYGSLN